MPARFPATSLSARAAASVSGDQRLSLAPSQTLLAFAAATVASPLELLPLALLELELDLDLLLEVGASAVFEFSFSFSFFFRDCFFASWGPE